MAHGNFKDLLNKGGFQAFLWTQFLGAFNDSVYQTIVALHAGAVKGGMYVPLVPAVFTLPSLLFSGYSGHLADRVSKRSVLISIKVFEIAIMLFGLATLRAGWTEGMLGVVFLMGLHAAVFSPAKYGIVPEMLPDRDLSRGNALLEMSTFVAIVLISSRALPRERSRSGSISGTIPYFAGLNTAACSPIRNTTPSMPSVHPARSVASPNSMIAISN